MLHEAGLAFDAVLASTKTHKLQDGTDFYTINELGYVPVLELDNGERLREGPAIVQYIADQVPAKNLAPANGTMDRYRLQEWLTFIGTELHRATAPVCPRHARRLQAPGARTPAKPLRLDRQATGGQGLPDGQLQRGRCLPVHRLALGPVCGRGHLGPCRTCKPSSSAWKHALACRLLSRPKA